MRHFSIANLFSLLYLSILSISPKLIWWRRKKYVYIMIPKKLFALFVLIWTLWLFVLFYLYFFVYYTATLIISSNEAEFRGELISVRNAQKISFSCPESECIVRDIPPFEYKLSLYKEDFKTQHTSVSMKARTTQEMRIEFERNPRLTLRSVVPEGVFVKKDDWLDEWVYLSFVSDDSEIIFKEVSWRSALEIIYISHLGQTRLREVPRISWPQIHVEYIRESNDIFMRVGDQSFIYERWPSNLIILPFEIPLRYVKKGYNNGQFHIVTELGSFTYMKQTNTAEFQYLFFDSVVLSPESIIWIILPDDIERRWNFDLWDEGKTLIIHYNSRTRERKILLSTSENIKQIHKYAWQVHLITSQWESFLLENF